MRELVAVLGIVTVKRGLVALPNTVGPRRSLKKPERAKQAYCHIEKGWPERRGAHGPPEQCWPRARDVASKLFWGDKVASKTLIFSGDPPNINFVNFGGIFFLTFYGKFSRHREDIFVATLKCHKTLLVMEVLGTT
ncbi:hypothetical protein HAX54_028740 [Datura stramonium]|uniref:Uncharacterized protein n=1 Tax=Datura stramonium TaxID=4076 RepID=A0ABS8V6T2_DATST|nr:hypothetical protein [Datura stramonium]